MPFNRTLKIGLIGFSATIVLALVLKLLGVSPTYIAPFALPWAVMVIIGVSKNHRP